MDSLSGLRVLNTRPQEQNKSLSLAIRNAGGFSVELPALSIQVPDNAWLPLMPDLSSIEQAVFVSTNAVQYFFRTLKQGNIHWNNDIKVTAVGHATAIALEQFRVHADFIPQVSNSEHLLQLETLHTVVNQTIILVKGEGGRAEIVETLVLRGANLITLDVYKRGLPEINRDELNSLWQDDGVDIVLFTSEQAIRNIFTMFGESARHWLCNKPCLVISERLASVAYVLGVNKIILSTYETILDSLYVFKQGLTNDQSRLDHSNTDQ